MRPSFSGSPRVILVFGVSLILTLVALSEDRFEVAFTTGRTRRRRHSPGRQHSALDHHSEAADFFREQRPPGDYIGKAVDERPTNSVAVQPKQNVDLQVAWVMSFGGSGTSYTIGNLEVMTNTTTATNYVEYEGACVPMVENLDLQLPPSRKSFVWASPCWHRPGKPQPISWNIQSTSLANTANVMTKTHCAAYCMDCPVTEYRIKSAQQFQQACQTGTRRNSDTRTTSFRYPPALRVSRAIHLIRDPFDNIVGRLHLAVKRRARSGKPVYDNLRDWCHYLDQKAAREVPAAEGLFPKGFYDRFRHVPCHMEFFRYIQWHNLAYQMMVAKKNEDPASQVLHLYYEDYARDYNATTHQLLNFLQLNHLATGAFKSFKAGKSYRLMFSDDFQKAVTAMLRELALPPVWNLLQRRYSLVAAPRGESGSSKISWADQLWPFEQENKGKSSR